ncbi:MAG: polyprenyl synthetase family protein, partial [Bacteroidota bacterium]|nr:polyprenyl synthetase family protein [Bacteroidota bacterium]
LLQIQKSRQMNTDEETYFRIIGDKTASLLATCCEIGARSASEHDKQVEQLRAYGEAIGIAFQIRDDLLDFLGTERSIGKPVGGDLKEKKFTLPLIHAFRQAPSARRKAVLRALKNGVKRKEIAEILEFVTEFGGIDYADRVAKEHRDHAIACLADFPQSEAKQALVDLAGFVVSRSR